MRQDSTHTITILGCGWLGEIIGTHFVKQGWTVFGSSRSDSKTDTLTQKGIRAFHADFTLHFTVPDSLKDSSFVFLFLPPSSSEDKTMYPKLLASLASQFSPATRFIFSSSTGVYPPTAGTYSEDYTFQENETNHLYEAEKQLRNLLGKRLIILRLGGLIGPQRHPIYSLQGRSLSLDGTSPVNLIHAFDIARALELLVENPIEQSLFNLVHPEHPTRENYYRQAATFFGLKSPLFLDGTDEQRIISGAQITQKTAFHYVYSPNDFGTI